MISRVRRIQETSNASDLFERRGRRAGTRLVLSILAASVLVGSSFVGSALVASTASAQGLIDAPMTPLQLSIAAGYSQLFKNEVPVYGLRASLLWGEQEEINGLDVGLFHTAAKTNGVSVGVYNGLSESGAGVQLGLGSYVQQSFSGVQLGMANAIAGKLQGAQIGFANQVVSGTGLQFGALNITQSMKGIQLGLWNVNPNGFLPYFPLFNFSFQDSPDADDEDDE